MKPITVVGGGLAGLALGIGLRQQEVPVTVWEAGHYPRPKVCGEFISGRGQDTLKRLGVQQKLLDAGARWARDAAFYVAGLSPLKQMLPQPALCISRYVLDQLLAVEFCRLGGELRERQRWSGDFGDTGVVRATGHRVEAAVDGWRWFGLKVHARNLPMDADLEVHLLSDGYVGLCRLTEGVNICGLFRSRQPIPDLRRHWREHLTAPVQNRLANAELEEDSFCAIAGLCLEPRSAVPAGECAIGDALTMIPPVTGNGMSMALESAELAIDPLTRFSRGELGWTVAQREISNKCNRRFASRLRVAGKIQVMLFRPWQQRTLLRLGRRIPTVLNQLFHLTR